MAAIDPILRSILQLLGDPFLEYVLAVNSSEIRSRLDGQSELTPNQEEVLGELLTLSKSAASIADDTNRLLTMTGMLGNYHDESGMSVAAAMREFSCGDVSAPPIDYPVAAALTTLARDAYPVMLIPPPFPEFGFHTPMSLVQHPGRERVSEAIMEDDQLKNLFPTVDKQGPAGYNLRSTGTGGGQQLLLFPPLLTHLWALERA